MQSSHTPTSTLRANQGELRFRRVGAAVDLDLTSAAPQRPGDISGMEALLAQIDAWSQSPDIYAVVLRASAWTRLPAEDAAPIQPSPATRSELQAFARLMWRLDCFPKPLVALIDGPLTGVPLALASVATHRVGTETARFRVAPVGDSGHLPLDGLPKALARLPGHTGLYLAMTGDQIGAQDALALGLLTHLLPGDDAPAIIAALADSQPVDPLLDARTGDVASGAISAHTATIDHCFGAANLEGITARLAATSGTEAEWAKKVLAALTRQSSPNLEIAQRLIFKAHTLDLRDTLHVCYRLAVESSHDFSVDAVLSANSTDDFSLPPRTDFAFGRF